MALYRVLKDRKTGTALHARPDAQAVPLATLLTEEREFLIEKAELTVDEARTINGEKLVREVISVAAKDAQKVMSDKLLELGYDVKVL